MGKYGQSVWMGRLPERVRSRDIEDFFRGYGKILDVSIKTKFGEFFFFAKKLETRNKIITELLLGAVKKVFRL